MKKYQKLAVFGGTFSPIHNGHIKALRTYAEVVRPDVLYVIPTAIPPHKIRKDDATDAERLEMLHLALDDQTFACPVVISDLELKRGGKSYTVDTVAELSCLAEEVVIYCGTDMFCTLEEWHDYLQLFETATIAYMQREDAPEAAEILSEKAAYYRKKYAARLIALPPLSEEMSSSQIRARINGGESVEHFLPDTVISYIEKTGLYQTRDRSDSIDRLRKSVCARLGDYRAAHVLSTEKEAVRLAKIFLPEMIDLVRISALLHDITKEYAYEKQMQIFDECGIIPDEVTKHSPKVLHALTAALLIPKEYPEFADETVISAVRKHTTGSADMSVMDCLIYLADYIEPSRKFEDCRTLRSYFWDEISTCTDPRKRLLHLYRTMVLSFDLTMQNLIEEQCVIAPDTIAARNAFLMKIQRSVDNE